jgi:hypothetical protein
LKALWSTLAVALLGFVLLPAGASAATFVVNVSGDIEPGAGCNVPQGECGLWEAIALSNETVDEEDTIVFSVPEVVVGMELPAVSAPVTIDGTALDGDPGTALVTNQAEPPSGLIIEANESTVEGLAIGGFNDGIVVSGSGNRICNSFVGTDLSGEATDSNRVGLYVAPTATGTQIGAGCVSGGNVISGNGLFGIVDDGTETHIAGNLVGTDVTGMAGLPNGPSFSVPAGGIHARGTGAMIGGAGLGEGNVIAFNVESLFAGGGGVVVESTTTAIRGNSIFANEERGIVYEPATPSPAVPAITTVSSVEDTATVVIGAITAGADEAFTVDVFANEVCDEYESGPEEFTDAGEGETYLGSAGVTTDGAGKGTFTATVPVQPQGTILTATATREPTGSTSEFSGCVTAPAVAPKPPPPNPDTGGGGAQTSAAQTTPPPAPKPENGETVAVEPKSGTVFVTLPGGQKVKLTAGQTIPVGSIVNATRGKVTLTSINRAGVEQTAVFFGGVFLVQQHEGSGLVILKLRGALAGCKAAKQGGAGRRERGGKKGRRLWGSGKGNFRTEGNHGSATVRGTTWLTEDRCKGTFFRVTQGTVTIRDFDANETFLLKQGKSYLAEP